MITAYRIWRWSPLRRKWLTVRECSESQLTAAKVATRYTFNGCPIAVEWLIPKSEREQIALLERMTKG